MITKEERDAEVARLARLARLDEDVAALRARVEVLTAALRGVMTVEPLAGTEVHVRWSAARAALADTKPAPDLDMTDPGPMAVLHASSEEPT